MNRREFVVGGGGMLIAQALSRRSEALQAPTVASSGSCSYATQLPDMLVSYLTKEQNRIAGQWDRRRELLRTADDVLTRNRYVRDKVIEMLHGLPDRSPLEAVTCKTLHRQNYRIESVMFQSRPNFWVTGSLYIPCRGTGPFPGIISPCGHYPLGRMQPTYQTVYLNLVMSGFVVLAYDPIGQGERRQYWNPQTNRTEVSDESVYEHSMPGLLLLLLGESLSQYFIWDGMRALDYLTTRPEVDPRRIGCAGHSGGGTLTKFISALDERVQCSAIMEGGTANRWPLNLSPWQPITIGDMEQDLFPAAVYGIDNVDLQVAIAPRPLLIGIESYGDRFNRAASAIRERYKQLGTPERFATVAADDPHSWTSKLRLSTADWFSRWFYGRPGPTKEPPLHIEDPKVLYCTPDGSIRYSGKGQTIFSIISECGSRLAQAQTAPSLGSNTSAIQDDHISGGLRKLLRIQKTTSELSVCQNATTPRNGYRIEKVQFLSEPGIYVPTWVYIAERPTRDLPVILYVGDTGVESVGMEFAGEENIGMVPGLLQTFTLAGYLVVAIDVRGIGETRPPHAQRTPGSSPFNQLFGLETNLTYMSWFIDQSLLGMRVQDVLRAVEYIMSRHDLDGTQLHVIGQGMGGLWSLFATTLDPRIKSLIIVDSLLSYYSLTQVDRYLYSADVILPDVLHHFDLPQVAGSLCGRPLALLRPRDAMKMPVQQAVAEHAYRSTRYRYDQAGMGRLFTIKSDVNETEIAQCCLDLIHGAISRD